jgi:hAT family C-terminal dimerisation region
MDYLPIPGSAVPCERVFLSAKEMMTPQRNRISEDLIEALQGLKYSLQHGSTSRAFTAGLSGEEELEMLEAEAKYDNMVATDPALFREQLSVF